MLGWHRFEPTEARPGDACHIPVQVVTLEEDSQHGLARGAYAFLTKPATTETLVRAMARLRHYATPHRKKLLIIEDNPGEQLSIRELLGSEDVDIEAAETGADALRALREEAFDCAVLDLRLPDMSGFEVLEHLHADDSLQETPVVVYTGKELSPRKSRSCAPWLARLSSRVSSRPTLARRNVPLLTPRNIGPADR